VLRRYSGCIQVNERAYVLIFLLFDAPSETLAVQAKQFAPTARLPRALGAKHRLELQVMESNGDAAVRSKVLDYWHESAEK
jgi:hypothetical protein